MLSDKLECLHNALGVVGRTWSAEEFNLLNTTLLSAIDDAKALEAQVVSDQTRELPYPDNVINLAVILNRRGVTVGMPATNDEGGAA